jgi:hypothetical protein
MTGVTEVMNKKHQVTELIVTFSGPVNAAQAEETSIYHLATPGKKGSFTAKDAGIIHLKKALYASAGDTVTLTLKRPVSLAKPVQLVVVGTGASGLQDSFGRLIDGDDDGQGGSNAVAVLTKKRVTIDAVELTRTSARARTSLARIWGGEAPSEPNGKPARPPGVTKGQLARRDLPNGPLAMVVGSVGGRYHERVSSARPKTTVHRG